MLQETWPLMHMKRTVNLRIQQVPSKGLVGLKGTVLILVTLLKHQIWNSWSGRTLRLTHIYFFWWDGFLTWFWCLPSARVCKYRTRQLVIGVSVAHCHFHGSPFFQVCEGTAFTSTDFFILGINSTLYLIAATGYTEYYFNEKSGKVCRHIEHWNVPKMALLKQIIQPSRGRKSSGWIKRANDPCALQASDGSKTRDEQEYRLEYRANTLNLKGMKGRMRSKDPSGLRSILLFEV